MKSLKHLFLLLALTYLASGMVGLSSRAQLVSPTPGQSSPQTKSGSSAPARTVADEKQTQTWKNYQDPSIGFTFRYPQDLILSREGNRIKLQHSIKYKHLDPCDYSDNTRSLLRLVDFDLSFELVNERSSTNPDTKQSNSGDFGSITVGSLKGEFERISVEGCGEYRYRFPLAGDRMLIVRREIIGIFSPTAQKFVNEKIVLKQPGIIKPEEEERLFNTILSTFKLAEAK